MFLGFSEGCLASKSHFSRSHFSYGFHGAKWPAMGPKGYKRDRTRGNKSSQMKKMKNNNDEVTFHMVITGPNGHARF